MKPLVSRDTLIFGNIEDGSDLARLTSSLIEGHWKTANTGGFFGPFTHPLTSPLGLRFELSGISDAGVTMIREVFDAWTEFSHLKADVLAAFSMIDHHIERLVDVSERCFRAEIGPRYSVAHQQVFDGYAHASVGRVKTFFDLAIFSYERGLLGNLPTGQTWTAPKPLADLHQAFRGGFVTLQAAADWARNPDPARLQKRVANLVVRRTDRSEHDQAEFMVRAYELDLRGFGHAGDGRGWRKLRREDWVPEFAPRGHGNTFGHVIVPMSALLEAFPPAPTTKSRAVKAKKIEKRPNVPERALQKWWQGLDLETQGMSRSDLWALARSAFPRHYVRRQQIVELTPNRRPGPR